MKTKMFLSLLLLAAVVPGALAATDEAEKKAHRKRDSVLVSPVEDPASKLARCMRQAERNGRAMIRASPAAF